MQQKDGLKHKIILLRDRSLITGREEWRKRWCVCVGGGGGANRSLITGREEWSKRWCVCGWGAGLEMFYL